MNKQDWTYKKLGEVATFVKDGDWIESKDQSECGIRLIQTGNVGNGVFKLKDDKPHYITEETMTRLGCTEIFKSDCLVSRLPDPVGRACILPDIGCRMITAVDCSIIRFGEDYLPQFFVDYTQSSKYRNSINNNTTGTTRKRISRKNLERIPIPVPPIEEQERIVAELDLLSGIIEKKKEQLKAYDQLAQSIFYDMFGDPFSNEKGWEMTCFGYIMTPAKSNKCKSHSELPILSITMHGGIVRQNERFKKVIASKDVTGYKIIKRGQLVIAFPIDEGLIYTQDIEDEGIMSPAYNVWDVDYKKVETLFLKFHLHSPSIMKYYKDKLRGTTLRRRMIPKEDLLNLPIPLPPLSLQQEFAEKIEAIERQKALVQQSIVETQTMFDYTMDKYFG